jgi:hypothetical protein
MSGFLKQQAASAMKKELLALERSFFLILQGALRGLPIAMMPGEEVFDFER